MKMLHFQFTTFLTNTVLLKWCLKNDKIIFEPRNVCQMLFWSFTVVLRVWCPVMVYGFPNYSFVFYFNLRDNSMSTTQNCKQPQVSSILACSMYISAYSYNAVGHAVIFSNVTFYCAFRALHCGAAQ